MRIALLLSAVGTALVLAVSASARPDDVFILEEHDTIIVEAKGCRTDCTAQGSHRVCRVKDAGCRAVCRSIPECKLDGAHPLQACAVVRDRAF